MNLKRIVDEILTKREEFIFKEYYDRSRTLEDIGHDLNVTRERARQIKLKALLKIQKQIIHEQRVKMKEVLIELPRAKSLEELDLSVRAWNCLYHRADIDTISELLKRQPEQLVAIRGLGRNTYQEILDKVHARGYTFVWEGLNEQDGGNQ